MLYICWHKNKLKIVTMRDLVYAIQDFFMALLAPMVDLSKLELTNWWSANIMNWLLIGIGFAAMLYWLWQLKTFNDEGQRKEMWFLTHFSNKFLLLYNTKKPFDFHQRAFLCNTNSITITRSQYFLWFNIGALYIIMLLTQQFSHHHIITH